MFSFVKIVGRAAGPPAIADVTVIGAGFGLHWPALDLDYTVPGLVNGVFGKAKWMAAKAAARANGATGGRREE
jgi:hypothetical protein